MTQFDFQKLQARLPKCPGIQAREKYFNSAVLVPLVWKEGEYSLLFQKRAKQIRQGGEICFPGGRYDPQQDQDYEATALRETMEELGIARQKIRILGRLDTVLAPHGVAIDPFVGLLDIQCLDELSLDPQEVARVFLLPVSFFEDTPPQEYHVRVEVQPSYVDEHGKETILLPAKELGLPERYTKPWGGKQYKILFYNTPEEAIWGMTAGILYDFIQKLAPPRAASLPS